MTLPPINSSVTGMVHAGSAHQDKQNNSGPRGVGDTKSSI